MEVIGGFHTPLMGWLRWSDFQGCRYRPTSSPTSSWEVRLGTRSAASPCSGSNPFPDLRRLGLLLAPMVFLPGALLAQLTTGTVAGTVRAADGHRLAGESILITGGAGWGIVIRTNSKGEFSATLPYGRYRLSGEAQSTAESSGGTVFVAPLQATRIDL